MIQIAVQKKSVGLGPPGWGPKWASIFWPSGISTTRLLSPLSSSDLPFSSRTRKRQTIFSRCLNWLSSTQTGPGAPAWPPRTMSPSKNSLAPPAPWACAAEPKPRTAPVTATAIVSDFMDGVPPKVRRHSLYVCYNDNSPRLVFKEPRRVLRPLRRCKQLSPGKASLGDGPWPFGLQKQSELNQVSFLVTTPTAQFCEASLSI